MSHGPDPTVTPGEGRDTNLEKEMRVRDPQEALLGPLARYSGAVLRGPGGGPCLARGRGRVKPPGGEVRPQLGAWGGDMAPGAPSGAMGWLGLGRAFCTQPRCYEVAWERGESEHWGLALRRQWHHSCHSHKNKCLVGSLLQGGARLPDARGLALDHSGATALSGTWCPEAEQG